MELLKEIFETTSQRIRSPFWGFIAISFVGTNWTPLFYLFLGDTPTLERIAYFKAETSLLTLFIIPIVTGTILALLSPYVSNFGSWWSESQISNKKLRDVQLAHKIASSKNLLFAQRENERTLKEQSLLNRAKIDQEVEGLDDEIREDLEKKIGALREETRNQMEPLKGAELFDSEGPSSQLGDMIDVVNKNWGKMILGRLSTAGEEAHVYGLRNSQQFSFPEALKAVKGTHIFDISDGDHVIDTVQKLTRNGDILLVSGHVNLLKKDLKKFSENGVVVISIPETDG